MVLVAIQLSALGLYRPPVLWRTSVPPQMIISLPVQIAVCSLRAEGTLSMLVAVQLLLPALYLPPVFEVNPFSYPPQTIISLPVQTAV